jgi:hypothetical protein
MLFVDSNALHVSGVSRPSSGAHELGNTRIVTEPIDYQLKGTRSRNAELINIILYDITHNPIHNKIVLPIVT